MRVIAGKYKRRTLVAPPGQDITRPTSDRVKESLFNIISEYLPNAVVLDLFSGSGALGIEALSRGAERVLFVEKDTVALRYLNENLKKLQIPSDQYCIVNTPVEHFFDNPLGTISLPKRKEDFAASITLIFADPPYASTWYDSALESIENSGLCHTDCLVVLEMSATRTEVHAPQGWEKLDSRTYGTTRIEFWRLNEE